MNDLTLLTEYLRKIRTTSDEMVMVSNRMIGAQDAFVKLLKELLPYLPKEALDSMELNLKLQGGLLSQLALLFIRNATEMGNLFHEVQKVIEE